MLSYGTKWRSSEPSELPDIVWRTLCANRDGKGQPAHSVYSIAMSELLQIVRKVSGSISSIDVEELLDTGISDDVGEYLRVVREVVWNRRVFRGQGIGSNNGLMVGLIPQFAQEGDKLCILFGCSVPLVLRKHVAERESGATAWQLIGEAYIHGYMDGQGVRSMTKEILRSATVEFEIR